MWIVIWNILQALASSSVAGVVTGTGSFFDFSPVGLADDIVALLFRKWITKDAKMGFVENLAFSVFTDELKKLLRAGEELSDEQDKQDFADGQRVEFGFSLVPMRNAQFDVADAALLWWGADTVISSGLPAWAIGLAAGSAVVL